MNSNFAIRIEDLYRGLQRAHGTFKITGADEVKAGKKIGKAVTIYDIPTVEKWESHLNGGTAIGIVPINESNNCRWGAIDIDVYRAGVVEELEEKCRKLNLPVIVIRTKSGGAHVTAFLTRDAPAKMVRSKMMEMAACLGVAGVEIYPKQVSLASERDCGNWLNMPYYDAKDTTRYAVHKGRGLDISEFLDLAYAMRMEPEMFAAKSFGTEGEAFSDGPPCLQTLAAQGVVPGTRNEALFSMGVYARMTDDITWEERVDDMNQLYISPPLSSREVQAVVKSLQRKSYFYMCTKPPLVSFCNKELCKQREYGIGAGNTDPEVEIGKFVKICTEPPTWIIDVEGARFEAETDDLMSQTKFQKLCIERINHWPATLKPNNWRKIVQERIQSAELVEAPEEASPEGRFIWHLEQFCSYTSPARSRDELLLGKPWEENGKQFFRSEDLMKYLTQHQFKEVSSRRAWSILRHKLGAVHQQFNIKGKCVQCWAVPAFKRQTEEFDNALVELEF